ncbi:MAG: hypothetical protein GY696_17640 [Gammaproteobacteria bacterium]|nr:hypothetical protein [Gammaproteobacteria bacterium]
MDEPWLDKLGIDLMDEIVRMEFRVATFGRPKDYRARSNIARYGKLLFLSQRLLKVIPELQFRMEADDWVNSASDDTDIGHAS